MASTRSGRRDLESYSINGTEKIIRRGDCVLMQPEDLDDPLYVARVVKLEKDRDENVNVYVRWYYRPEDSKVGRRNFHGEKELLLSDHYDWQSAYAIVGKCVVHSLTSYKALKIIKEEDYFSRFEYRPFVSKGLGMSPKNVDVYCRCGLPYNPDENMVGCDGCGDWFHFTCVDLTYEEAINRKNFFCPSCDLQK
ncbi:chromatin remodeling protein EBS-like [Rutidosis leptorrhynchoides]|uniref:chromatin remodeling protein EBS-like n=1 Tax=Rutidosis leptorrhynchoides TaxID=125765 RepID=UPI003A9A5191